MEDNLKKYLDDHRDDFEREIPRKDLWSKIDTDLRPKKKKRNFFTLKIAASLIFALGLGMMAMRYLIDNPKSLQADTQPAMEDSPIQQLSEISPDLAAVESFYIQKVNVTMDELNRYHVDEELIQEVDYLKEEFEVLKKEMGIGADQSIVVEAMIDNYRLRLMLLEDLLHAVAEDNHKNKRDYEKSI